MRKVCFYELLGMDGAWVCVWCWMAEWWCILESMARPEYHFMTKY